MFSRGILAGCLVGCALAIGAPSARADAGWFESGDTLLRTDLQLLNDAEVIRLPIQQWPIPRAAVEYALSGAKDFYATNAAVAAALDRVRARLAAHRAGTLSFDASLRGGSPALLRDFDSLAREEGELSLRGEYESSRTVVALNVTGVTSPADGHAERLDGSHATLQLGNWLVGVNTLDRWWGPAHDSSLILSNNARPMPTFLVERAAAKPFESPWLRWLGPWRFSFGISRMEDEREDIDRPLFMAWRVSIMPFRDIELGFSRTAQFCGEQLECDLESFGNMLAGNDNVGIDATPENEPGNQMAGFDIRWASPIGDWPYAVYSQMIGEDESSYLPVKFLAQFGIEAWAPLANGAIVQAYAEYADNTCSANRSPPRYDCSYNQGRFNVEGYRFRGRVIGHTADNDAKVYTLGVNFTAQDGDVWSASARSAKLNRAGDFSPNNTVSPSPVDYATVELGWRGRIFGDSVSIDIGAEAKEPLGGDRHIDPYGFLSWRHEFSP